MAALFDFIFIINIRAVPFAFMKEIIEMARP